MKRRMNLPEGLRALLTTLLLGVAGCSCVAPPPAYLEPAEVVVDQRDAGSTISLQRGDRLIVILPGNPSTGFGWALASADNRVLVLQGEPEFIRDSKALGAGGRYRFTFAAAANGKVPLSLVYRRSFEAKAPAGSFEVIVEVLE